MAVRGQRRGLFGSYPMFRIAYGTKGMRKFRLGEEKII